jgi:uncharacterized membrane protein (UPF0182 family)
VALNTIDWAPRREPQRPVGLALLVTAAIVLLGSGTFLSYYVESLWFDALGFSSVFWTTLRIRSSVFTIFFALTFFTIYGSFLALKPARLTDLAAGLRINGRPVDLPVEPVLRLIALLVALALSILTGLGVMADWTVFGQYWYQGGTASSPVDQIFGRPVTFYMFTLPVWRLIAGWFTGMAVIVCTIAAFFVVLRGGAHLLTRETNRATPALRGVSIAFAAVLLGVAFQVYLGRYARLLTDHTIFAGVTYTDAHVAIPGMMIVASGLVLGALMALVNAIAAPRLRWLVASVLPAAVAYVCVSIASWYVTSFLVRPNELVRERPYIANNIEMTRQAFGLTDVEQMPFLAENGIEAIEPERNRETLSNIRLWDWRALQDALRQIQEIRTYYDFPDIDIDRYEVGGSVRQMMLAARELNIERLPESSRNWINERLVYTHGYGVTMNPVNGFTSEGLPALILSDMPVQSTTPEISVTRPEIYFGELTNGDVYVKTGQQEFNYPQGDTNSMTTYAGTGGIVMGGFFRRLILAIDRGDVTRMPFSDDVTSESRLLMRRNIRERVEALAPFLIFDTDPYIVVTAEGRLVWMIDAFTTSANYPNARHYRIGNRLVNYMRNSVKATVDAYDGTVTFFVFDTGDPVLAAYRRMFPALFTDGQSMPADLRKHVRYPELLLEMQAAVYGLYHMTSPDVFYNREDLWTVASEVGPGADNREQAARPMEPNFLLMKLPGEEGIEFVEILPFTPANRNNLIGWIAGRSDGANYGSTIVYNFPKTKLVDGPLQIEARVDQNGQLSSQLSLWNQQGSNVRRGSLLVIPIGRALLYAQPIYLQAERSPMPELRIVVLALQDKLAYGPTFESALAALLGNAPSSLSGTAPGLPASQPQAAVSNSPAAAPPETVDRDTLINEAARDLEEYQQLTAEGRLGEAGQRLESLKQRLERLQRMRR